MSPPTPRRLGAILVDAKVLSEPSLSAALDNQRDSGKRLGAVLVEMGLVDHQTIVVALGIQSNLPVADLRHRRPDHRAVGLVPEQLARRLSAVPLRRTPRGLEVAVGDPLDDAALALLENTVGEHVVLRLAPLDELRLMIDRCYPSRRRHGPRPPAALPESEKSWAAAPAPDETPPPPLDDGHDLLHAIVTDALDAGASDIHLEPQPGGTRVRYRIDGTLRDGASLTDSSGATVVRCAKRMAGGSSGGRKGRGHFDLTVNGRPLRTVVNATRTIQGERLRLRLVPGESDGIRGLGQLGMPDDMRREFAAGLQRPSGLIVIAGPRRSGRTTTAYAALAELNTPGRSIVFVQRMVTRVFPSVSQVEIGANPVVPALMAAVEDQDADGVVIDGFEGVGVVRAAIRMAEQGLLVVITVTALDAVATAARLLDAAATPLVLATTLHSVLAQRLEPRPGTDGLDGSYSRVATFVLHQ